MEHSPLIEYFGGTLQNLVLPSDDAERLKIASENYLSITLTYRQLCDLEMLASGAYSPLTRFMGKETYDAVVDNLVLPDGRLWPIPITFDVDEAFAAQLTDGTKLALRDAEGFMLAVMTIDEIWSPDKEKEAEHVYGTRSRQHFGVKYLLEKIQNVYISGELDVIQLPEHYVFSEFSYTPHTLRQVLQKNNWGKVLGYQTSTPIHQLHRNVLLDVAKEHHTQLVIQPTIGGNLGDTHYVHYMKGYNAVLKEFPLNIAMLALMPHSMRMAGPRETLLYAIVHQNYGCSHFLVGPYHASATQSQSKTHYGQYDSQAIVKKYQHHLAIIMVAVEEYHYQCSRDKFRPKRLIAEDNEEGVIVRDIEFKQKMHENSPLPAWFSFPEVIKSLKNIYKPISNQGFTLFFTGLSGSGKSTLAKIVYAKLLEHGSRPVTLLDGDVVRLNLSSELGFSKRHRNLNIRRIGFVSNEISKNGGIAICAPIAPYAHTRNEVRELIEQNGVFIEIHVATPLEECEARDRKGLYAKARKGLIPEFTGISDPYEIPENPELAIDTTNISPTDGAQRVLLYLLQQGFLDS